MYWPTLKPSHWLRPMAQLMSLIPITFCHVQILIGELSKKSHKILHILFSLSRLANDKSDPCINSQLPHPNLLRRWLSKYPKRALHRILAINCKFVQLYPTNYVFYWLLHLLIHWIILLENQNVLSCLVVVQSQ